MNQMYIAGIDEAGRGPVLGPLVIAGVVIDEKDLNPLVEEGLTDSKLMPKVRRESMYAEILNLTVDYQVVIIDAYEIDADTIFVYVIGHGNNVGGHSYTYFADGGSNTGSHTFRGYMDLWEANRKCILVESCEAGDWADDFAASPYLAMATSDESHSAYTYQDHATPWEGDFSHWFFYAIVTLGYNAVDAFDYASGEITHTQNPKMQDYSSYEWFD